MTTSRCVCLAVLLTTSLWGRASAAQPTGETAAPTAASGSAAAEALFQQGRALLAEGKTAEACERFAGSQRIEAKLGTLLNLALCHETMGLHATAWAEFTSAANLAARDGQGEREAFAREHVAALEPKLSTLALRVSAPAPGTSITLDGRPFPAISALPIDPGRHALEVTAPGRTTWRDTVEVVGERRTVEVVVPPLAVAPAARESEAAPPTRARRRDVEGGDVPTVAIVSFAVAGTALVVGTVTGIVALAQTSDLSSRCDGDVCPTSAQGDLDAANAISNVSNVSFVLAAVGGGVGLGALLLAGDEDESAAAASPAPVHVEPTLGLGVFGARGRF